MHEVNDQAAIIRLHNRGEEHVEQRAASVFHARPAGAATDDESPRWLGTVRQAAPAIILNRSKH
jgi:hypothetical protein